jgi:hypothetical protein
MHVPSLVSKPFILVEKLTQLERAKLLKFSKRVRPSAAQRAEFAILSEAWKMRRLQKLRDSLEVARRSLGGRA